MQKTAKRLELAAEIAESVGDEIGDELKSFYVLNQRELAVLPPVTAPQRSAAYEDAVAEGRSMKTHYDTSLQIHRMSGGGPKQNSDESGPVATAVNPFRHTMMINGRPVMALGVIA